MSLVLHHHPLSSFCWKVLIPLYENATPFEGAIVDFGDAESRAAFERLWPIAKMPVLEDRARGVVVPETSIIIEYLDRHYPGAIRFVPGEPETAREVRLWDRLFDSYVMAPMQRIVADRIRPEGMRDPFGVEEARGLLRKGLAEVDRHMDGRIWAVGDSVSLADCAAAPALFYANEVMPFSTEFPHAYALLERLRGRPAFARVLAEAEPWFRFFPRG